MAVTFMHNDSNLVDEHEVRKIQVPAKTRSYCPVPNGKLIDVIRQNAQKILKVPVFKQQFALSKNGQRMFGTMTFKKESEEHGISFGFGNCYDMSIALRLVAGLGIFICDNLSYSGDSLRYLRKHTSNVMIDLEGMIQKSLMGTEAFYERMEIEIGGLKALPCSVNRGYEVLGSALGNGIIKPTALNVAMNDWNNPKVFEMNKTVDGIKTSYECQPFKENNMYSLYNCLTEGIKKGEPAKRIERQIAVHKFMTSDDVITGDLKERWETMIGLT